MPCEINITIANRGADNSHGHSAANHTVSYLEAAILRLVSRDHDGCFSAVNQHCAQQIANALRGTSESLCLPVGYTQPMSQDYDGLLDGTAHLTCSVADLERFGRTQSLFDM